MSRTYHHESRRWTAEEVLRANAASRQYCKHKVLLEPSESCTRRYHGLRYSVFAVCGDLYAQTDSQSEALAIAKNAAPSWRHRVVVFDKSDGIEITINSR